MFYNSWFRVIDLFVDLLPLKNGNLNMLLFKKKAGRPSDLSLLLKLHLIKIDYQAPLNVNVKAVPSCIFDCTSIEAW